MSKDKRNRQRNIRKQQLNNTIQQQIPRKKSVLSVQTLLLVFPCFLLALFSAHVIANALLTTKYVPVSQTSVVPSITPVEHDNNGNITSVPSSKTGTP